MYIDELLCILRLGQEIDSRYFVVRRSVAFCGHPRLRVLLLEGAVIGRHEVMVIRAHVVYYTECRVFFSKLL